MIVTVWTNGNSGLGLKISAQDRDAYFKKEWACVILELEGLPYPVDVEVSNRSFWRWQYNQIRPHSALGYRPAAPETIKLPILASLLMGYAAM